MPPSPNNPPSGWPARARCSDIGYIGSSAPPGTTSDKIEPAEPIDKDLYDLPPDEFASVKQVPGSLTEVLDSLEADHGFLLEGGVFTPDLIETWVQYKRDNEVDPVRLRPTPHEFAMYFDV